MKYKIDPELKSVARQKIPEALWAFPILSFFIGLAGCRSDHTVRVCRYRTPGHEGAALKTLVIEPRQPQKNLPCIVFFHGGAFMLKASGAHYRIAKQYAEAIPCKVVYPDYRLAPKYKFPIPAEDCYRTYAWVLEHAALLGIAPDQILVAGDSAGGNLALTVTLMARDRGLPLPRAQMLIYPTADRRMQTESMRKYVDTPVWNARLSKIMWEAYLGGRHLEKPEYASPLEAKSFAHFPPTYLEVAEYDALRDEGFCLYHRLQEQGIPCELHEVTGACHGFETARNSNLLKKCMNRRIAWLKKRLNRPYGERDSANNT